MAVDRPVRTVEVRLSRFKHRQWQHNCIGRQWHVNRYSEVRIPLLNYGRNITVLIAATLVSKIRATLFSSLWMWTRMWIVVWFHVLPLSINSYWEQLMNNYYTKNIIIFNETVVVIRFVAYLQEHRVVIPEAPSDREKVRMSVVYFAQPDRDSLLQCLDGSDKYEPMTSLEFLSMRLRATYLE